MDFNEFAAYAYFFLVVFLVVVTYAYVYHLYTKKKDATGVDYEHYSNMALKDDIGDAPVKPVSRDKEK
ncbi:cytochrome c oxidase, cbb3-type, CcoQ subunit [Sulfurimonas paralvinellae]|uniref:Cytochrome c oxidase, cbb3-type, CcoQ subunit n=1 Tax=Sulfurimonas paralvinellae TaxID=317658 RepID=A0A7M1BAR5_9BACT|nr:cytochrome c oxidase, cbb3-type, CcoQ subunit [Sulfurimonas paralvinellae]QOP46506.1 cytochrome c oxidase, cbb3-type, CcoQ subunit [Sulfurimonas paralvinellae]